MYRYLILILVLASQLNLVAQEVKNFNYYDDRSLTLYEEGQWEQLIPLGKEALQQGHDFYYLRMRIGIAYYNLDRYKLAINQFDQALEFNNSDPVALEYLYYSYLFSGRDADALTLYKQNQEHLEKTNAQPTKLIKGIYTEGGFKFSDNQVDEVGNIGFFHAGLSHQITAGLNVYQGYTRLSQQFSAFTEVETGGNGPGPGSGGTTRVENKVTHSQDEYYIRGSLRLAKGWLLIPAYHYQAFADSLDNQAVSIGLTKHVGIASFYGAAGFSTINDSDQTQWTLGATVYPFANLNFYLQTNYTLHDQDGEQSNILYHKIGGRIMNETWLEAYYGWGDMYNFSEMDAFYVQNIPDIIESKTGVTFIRVLGQKHKLLVGYVLENKKQFDTGKTYKHHAIYAGLNIRL